MGGAAILATEDAQRRCAIRNRPEMDLSLFNIFCCQDIDLYKQACVLFERIFSILF